MIQSVNHLALWNMKKKLQIYSNIRLSRYREADKEKSGHRLNRSSTWTIYPIFVLLCTISILTKMYDEY